MATNNATKFEQNWSRSFKGVGPTSVTLQTDVHMDTCISMSPSTQQWGTINVSLLNSYILNFPKISLGLPCAQVLQVQDTCLCYLMKILIFEISYDVIHKILNFVVLKRNCREIYKPQSIDFSKHLQKIQRTL